MLLIEIPKIKIEIGDEGCPSTTQGDDMLDDCRAARGSKLLYTRDNEMPNQRMLFPEPATKAGAVSDM